MLRASVLDDRESWDDVMPVAEGICIKISPYETLYGSKCQTPLCWYQNGESMIVGPEMLQQTTKKVKRIKEKVKTSQVR